MAVGVVGLQIRQRALTRRQDLGVITYKWQLKALEDRNRKPSREENRDRT